VDINCGRLEDRFVRLNVSFEPTTSPSSYPFHNSTPRLVMQTLFMLDNIIIMEK
jgi:hypothetical protein